MNDTIVSNCASQRNNGAIYNRILQALPSEVREEVLRVCHPVEFPPTHVIYRAGEAVEHAYFINSGLVSLIKGMADGRTTVIGAVGTEGLVGVFAAAGFERALADYIVEVPVVAFRVRRSVLHREMAQHAALTCPGSSDHG
jgi:CRP-like cAMP-binding protein